MEIITRTRKLESYQGLSQTGRELIAGKTCKGKFMCLKYQIRKEIKHGIHS